MWFKRKSSNRRLGREHVLDVKLRSSKVRAARTRMAAVGLGTVFLTIMGIYLLWQAGEWTLDRLVYENKAFAIEEVDVQTDGVIAVDQLRRWARIKPQQNLLALDLARVQRDLELMPLIQSASVERVLPHTLRIRVSEREPLAQINLVRPRPGGGVELATFLVDADGYVMLPLALNERTGPANPPVEQLPLISGLNSDEVQPGRRLVTPQIQAALQLLLAFEESPMAGIVDIKRVDISSQEVLVVTTGQGSEVTFGLSNLDVQLRRWRAIFDAGQRAGKTIGSLDLAIPSNIPARWLEASALPLAAPKTHKLLHLRKKHV
jgi:cell division septal protein FtsQ